MKNLIDFLKSFFPSEKEKRENKLLKSCGCICYCPSCKNPLNDGLCEDIDDEIGLYKYTCSKCGEESHFNFGIWPVPIYIKEL